MHDEKPIGNDPEVADQRSHRLTRMIHRRVRKCEDRTNAIEIDLGDLSPDPLTRTLEGSLVIEQEPFDSDRSDVVAGSVVRSLRVPEANDEAGG